MHPIVYEFLKDLTGQETKESQLFRVLTDGYCTLKLDRSLTVRPSMLNHVLRIDIGLLKSYSKQISFNKLSMNRINRTNASLANQIQKKDDADEAWVTKDQLKEFDSACTKWCSQTFFPNAHTRLIMILNLCRVYEALRKASGLKFRVMFKGGVMMRLLLLEFLKNFSQKGRQNLRKYMDKHKALSLSDFDFEIVPDNHETDESQILSLFALDYAVLLWFQGKLEEERDGHVPAKLLNMNWDAKERSEHLKERLMEVVKHLPSTHPLHGAKIDRVVLSSHDRNPPTGYLSKENKNTTSPRNNVVIFECSANKNRNKETCVLKASDYFRYLKTTVDGSTGGSCFYATLNTFIGENETKKSKSHLPGLFHLSRIKHGFVMYYTTKTGQRRCDRLAGEIIDLSQSGGKRDDLRMWLYDRVHVPYRSYPIMGVDPALTKLRSYTPEAFCYDLRSQVHNTDSAPWDAGGKLPKRMLRYVAFAVVHVMSPYVPGSFEDKVHALSRTVSHLKDWDSLVKRRPNVGIPFLNDFLDRERETLLEHKASLSKKKGYVSTIVSHFNAFLDALDADDFDIFRVQEESELVVHAFMRQKSTGGLRT